MFACIDNINVNSHSRPAAPFTAIITEKNGVLAMANNKYRKYHWIPKRLTNYYKWQTEYMRTETGEMSEQNSRTYHVLIQMFWLYK